MTQAVDRARAEDSSFAVALVDIDNFRLLNENYGDAAGDRALLTIVEVFGRDLPPGMVLGRYGPDEILIVAGAQDVALLDPVLEGARAALADHSLEFDASERSAAHGERRRRASSPITARR